MTGTAGYLAFFFSNFMKNTLPNVDCVDLKWYIPAIPDSICVLKFIFTDATLLKNVRKLQQLYEISL
jgi:hypothetical protein